MTLTACYLDPVLQVQVLDIVTKDRLKEIVKKTIGFLNFIATRTSALATDAAILRHMAVKAGLYPEDERGSLSGDSTGYRGPESNNGSFTSVNTVNTPVGADHSMTG